MKGLYKPAFIGVLILLICCVPALPARAAEPGIRVRVGVHHIPEILEEQKGMFYWIIAETAKRLKERGVEMELSFLPPRRTIEYLKRGLVDCLYPFMISDFTAEQWLALGFKKPIMHSLPVAQLNGNYVIVTRTGSPRLNTLEDLAGKTVGLARGLFVFEDLNLSSHDIRFEFVNDEIQNIKKLSVGRIDAVISYRSLMRLNILKAGVDNVHAGMPFAFRQFGFGFYKGEQNEILRRKINEVIKEMISDGTYCRIALETQSLPGVSVVDCSASGPIN